MALDQFLKLAGIDGESKDDAHADEIDVLAWSWGASQSGSFHVGAGGGSGKANFQDISVTKYVDKATTPILKSVADGSHIDEAVLTVRKAGGTPVEYMIITMKKCMITSYSTGGSGGEDRLTENFTINFATVEIKYTPQKDDGSPDAQKKFGWNIQTNAKL